MLDLIEPVRLILDKVREATGKDFQFVEKSDLPTYATVKAARRPMPAHVVIYRRNYDEIINHLIAHECGHILRMFGVAEERRLIPQTDGSIEKKARDALNSELRRLESVLPAGSMTRLWRLWYEGTVRQLTNVPSDIRIEKWLYDDYPELRRNQEKSLKNQLKEAGQGLSRRVREVTPAKIYDGANSMNYAFFKVVCEHIGISSEPFRTSRFRANGEKLLELALAEPADNYEGDIATVNRWAEFLGLAGWFAWTGFENVPAEYLRSL